MPRSRLEGRLAERRTASSVEMVAHPPLNLHRVNRPSRVDATWFDDIFGERGHGRAGQVSAAGGISENGGSDVGSSASNNSAVFDDVDQNGRAGVAPEPDVEAKFYLVGLSSARRLPNSTIGTSRHPVNAQNLVSFRL